MKEDLCRRILDLPDEAIERVSRYVSDMELHEPNEETIAAFREAENLDNLTTCTDLQDMLRQCGIKR
jgi:hypothetical protein